jgi:diguanylate cyclase (GGDEF)-like protein
MIHLEKLLGALIEPTGRPAVRSRTAVVQRAIDVALTLLDAHGASVLMPGREQAWRYVQPGNLAEPKKLEAVPGGTEFSRLLMRSAVPFQSPDLSLDARVSDADVCPDLDSGPALFIPLRMRAQSPAYLALYRRRGSPRFGEHESALATMLGVWMSQAFESQRLSASVEKLAITDDLTQVYNFRFLKSALRREMKRAGRYRQKLSILMLDVDNLKSYNDRHGHLRGSFLLKQIAGRFMSQVRSFDLVAKYGGDEFTVILPQTDIDGAMVVAERMRLSVEQHDFPLAEAGTITVSIGVATFPDDGADAEALVRSADTALYAAKRAGRNRVVLATEALTATPPGA